MNKNEVFQFVNKLNNLDISTMIFRETVFDIISFGKANKIHLATTASLDRIKHVLTDYNLENAPDEKDTLKFTINNDTCYIHSIFKMSYDDFVKKMVATDLTFNSLLMKPDGQIYDMYGGLEDLKNKRLRFVDSFNEKNKTRLVLNCIRYIFKNGFTYDNAVKQYIEECLPSFTKSEKSNALFYLVEYINKEAKNADIELLLNNAFFKNDKTPDVDVSNYLETIANIGKEKYIYLLLILANININKTRFSMLIDAEDFTDIKESFALNLSDEMTYYDLKDKRGYEYLSHIVSLQKEYAKLTKTEYVEPIFHKETVFDLIEQSETSSVFTDDYILEEDKITEKIQLPKKDAFDFASSSAVPASSSKDYDFSALFTENALESTIPDDAGEIDETDDNTTVSDVLDVIDTSTSDVENLVDEDKDKTIDTPDSTDLIKNSESNTNDIQELPIDENEENTLNNEKNDDVIIAEQKTEKSTSLLDIDSLFDDETDEDEEKIVDTQEINDDIASILNTTEERNQSANSKKRNINPRFMSKKEDASAEEQDMTTVSTAAHEDFKTDDVLDDTVPVTPVIFDSPSFATNEAEVSLEGELPLEEMFATKPNDEVVSHTEIDNPVEVVIKNSVEEPIKEKTKTERKSSLIDDIFEEEVKTPEISLSPEFDALMSEVEKESKIASNDQIAQRKTVSETMLSDVVPEMNIEDDTPTNFDISEHELEEILAELNGKRKNSFIDDDDTSDDNDVEDVTSNFASSYSFNPQNASPSTYSVQQPTQTSSADDDFFKSLNDDFTEIVGGNS